ncbi:hypothetical protein FKG94_17125 [Exilibacterium tricleocarpae]|uniref:Tetratricopeptide repeat protein n=1 Tax=Exilibacterium tricleocarpae TaxID=2591008 RepID=A0A545T869_9GAMM|nr:hypothetical protein [Exilibacterium tricleocarpae]TQV73426.1 hypothetical protein FKG94_17125 [Exilibacterium tricleocarpae]
MTSNNIPRNVPSPVKRRPAWVLLVWLALYPALGQALKPEHEGARLLLAAEQAVEQKQFSKAKRYLAQAENLSIVLAPAFHYYKGRVLAHDGRGSEARRQLEIYVDKAGSEGPHYEAALRQITRLEENLSPRKPAASPKAEINWTTRPTSGKAYTERLQMLYMAGTPVEALVTHVNKLLDFYAYGDPRITAANRIKNPTKHSIRVSKRGEIISLSQLTAPQQSSAEEPLAKEERFAVFGVNPYVDHRCDNSTASCWILHPNNAGDWLQVVQSRDAVNELSKALTQLIKQLQKS